MGTDDLWTTQSQVLDQLLLHRAGCSGSDNQCWYVGEEAQDLLDPSKILSETLSPAMIRMDRKMYLGTGHLLQGGGVVQKMGPTVHFTWTPLKGFFLSEHEIMSYAYTEIVIILTTMNTHYRICMSADNLFMLIYGIGA